jgi:hypothetical protein
MWSLQDIIAMNDGGELGKRWWRNLKSNFTISFGECPVKSEEVKSGEEANSNNPLKKPIKRKR